jgi:hypothetical protein
VWYRYSKNNLRKIIAQKIEDILKMRELNKAIPPSLNEAKQRYIEQARQYSPDMNPQELEELWNEYVGELRKYPSFNTEYQDYESWRASKPNEEIERIVLEKDPKFISNLEKRFEEHPDETDFEVYKSRKLEEKARDIYNAEKDLGTLSQFGLGQESGNPLNTYNEAKKQWALKVADEYKQMIPETTPTGQQTVTLFIGYPGAGKSRYIEPQGGDQDNPVRMTNYGILVDPDEYQRDLVGYQSGAGSQNTLIYAVSVVKPEIQKEALSKGNDIVVPMVGGSPDLILNEAIRNLIEGYQVKVVIVPTDLATSHQRSLGRAGEEGNRLIMPTITGGNPADAFKMTEEIVKNGSADFTDLFSKKLFTKLGYTPAQVKKLPDEEKKSLRDRYAQMMSFEVAE